MVGQNGRVSQQFPQRPPGETSRLCGCDVAGDGSESLKDVAAQDLMDVVRLRFRWFMTFFEYLSEIISD